MNAELIDNFAAAGEKLALSIRGLTPQDLRCVPPADANVGRWSIQQVVMHVVDTDLVLADRMKRLIAEENPTLQGFDEEKWTANLHYDAQDLNDACALLDLNHRMMAKVLRNLPASAFSRKGTHTVAGPVTLGDVFQKAINHLEHHVKFIHAKRAHWGKEMW